MKNKYFFWLLAVALCLLVFYHTQFDYAAQSIFYETCCGWPFSEHPFWNFLYKYGVFAGYILAVWALITLTASFWWPNKWILWRKQAIYLIVVMALGPGVIVNLVLKDNWGRPRPRETTLFGGTEAYIKPWLIGNNKQGKSFPCGHCSMGFYIAVPYLIWRRKYPILAYSFLGLGVLFGALMGISRMMAGGHFLSDVVWSGIIVWGVALVSYHYIQPNQNTFSVSPNDKKKNTIWTIATAVLIPLLTVSVLVATPYISKKKIIIDNNVWQEKKVKFIKVIADEGNVYFQNSPEPEISYQVYAFGFPNSKIGAKTAFFNDTLIVQFEKTGIFTEVINHIYIKNPMLNQENIITVIKKGGKK